jgi:hypothetical protein
MALVRALFILVLGIAVASVGVIGMRRWVKDPTMPKRLPGFNVFTGRWSDDEKSSGRGPNGQSG